MLTTSPSLKNFIDRVPLCRPTAMLESLRSIFSQGNCDRVAVVNEQLQPLGLIYLRSLWAGAASGTHNWTQPLSESPIAIEPIRTVSAALSVSEFWQYLQTEEGQTPAQPGLTSGGSKNSPIGLTDANGKFLGMLDSQSLLEYIATLNSSQKAQPTAVKEIELTPVSQAIATALDAQVRFLEAGLKPSENLNSLVQLLEKLPLPLRLQTPTGQIVSQNAAWRILLGAGPEPVAEPATNLGKRPHKPSHLTSEDKSPKETLKSECRSLVGASRASGDSLRDSWAARDSTAVTSCPLPLYAAASPSTLTAPAWCPIAGKPDTYICECPVQKGQERTWQFVKQPLSDELILVMGQDVTEEHLVAKELAAKNADLIHLNRLKDEFLSCISHELKTPLTAVLGLSSLLKDKLIGELNDRQTRYAKLIHQSGRHLMTIVNDILDLTRMETGQLELIPEQVEIAATCKRAFEQAKQLQQQEEKSPAAPKLTNAPAEPEVGTQIEFTLEIEPGVSYLIADELRLRQMLVNLLSNALKFTEPGGKIGLKVNVWEGWIAFTVWDTGIGIPADKQHLIFQKFQQLESPLTRRFQGTGLGLVLTQRLARLHGGDVSFISSENQGSEFTLLLPPNPAGHNNEETPARTAAEAELFKPKYQTPIGNSRSRLVLIVEAVPKYIEDLTNVLSGLGYQVIIARSGTEALEKARRFSPEVIFLNPLLPLLSGWDVLTLLKSDPDTRSIPAIITATRGEKERASVNLAEGFLSLPVEEPALRKLLANSIARTNAGSPQVRSSLTVLWLSPQNSSSQGSALLLNPTYCRVLEADDLGQAELVARIWRPAAIVLDGTSHLQNPLAFIEQLSRSRNLGSLPLVTLDPVTTQLANQVKGLSVFPCLAAGSSYDDSETSGTRLGASALWQVIQVAAGMSWKPSILFADIATLPDLYRTASGNPTAELPNRDPVTNPEIPAFNSQFSTPNFQALIQYVQTAGFRGSIAPCWTEVLQQLQYQSVDLVLLCLRDAPSESPAMFQALSHLRQMAVKLPILVWDYRSAINSESEAIDFLLQEVSAKILPSSLSAAQLLDKIQHALLTR